MASELEKPVSSLEKYYFTEKFTCLKGVVPGSGGAIRDYHGPFMNFDKKTRILETLTMKIYLAEDEIEPSRNPPLYERTCTTEHLIRYDMTQHPEHPEDSDLDFLE